MQCVSMTAKARVATQVNLFCLAPSTHPRTGLTKPRQNKAMSRHIRHFPTTGSAYVKDKPISRGKNAGQVSVC